MPEVENPILVVEDELPVRQTIQWVLEDEGWAVEVASNGQEAIDLIADLRPSLVVLDMALPLVNGNGVAAGLHDRYGKGVPIVVITADGRAELKARQVGAADYLQKPFDLDKLVAAVRRILDGQAG